MFRVYGTTSYISCLLPTRIFTTSFNASLVVVIENEYKKTTFHHEQFENPTLIHAVAEYQIQTGSHSPQREAGARTLQVPVLGQSGQPGGPRQQVTAPVHVLSAAGTHHALRTCPAGKLDSCQHCQHVDVGRPVWLRQPEEGGAALLRGVRDYQRKRTRW